MYLTPELAMLGITRTRYPTSSSTNPIPMSQATPELVAGSFIVLDVDVSALSKETIAFIRSNPIWEDPDLGEDICEVQELEVQKGYNRLSDKAKDEVSDISFEAFRRMACYVRLIRQ